MANLIEVVKKTSNAKQFELKYANLKYLVREQLRNFLNGVSVGYFDLK